jgi:hypothetical protein
LDTSAVDDSDLITIGYKIGDGLATCMEQGLVLKGGTA